MNKDVKRIFWMSSAMRPASATPKKVGALPVEGRDELKQTNEIGMFILVVDTLDIDAKTITGDALLTQRKLAYYLVAERSAYDVFIAKDNQPSLAEVIHRVFDYLRMTKNS